MIIGLCGRKNSGKNQVAQFIRDIIPHAEERAFADPMKRAIAELLDISLDLVEQFKNKEDVVWTPVDWEHHKNVEGIPALNMRQLLQRIGTEVGRAMWGETFWIDQCLPADLDHRGRLIVVTDVRYSNEVERIQADPDGYVWIINRPSETKDAHPSEQLPQFSPEFIINNQCTLEELRVKVREGLQEIGLGTQDVESNKWSHLAFFQQVLNTQLPSTPPTDDQIIGCAARLVNVRRNSSAFTNHELLRIAVQMAATAYAVTQSPQEESR